MTAKMTEDICVNNLGFKVLTTKTNQKINIVNFVAYILRLYHFLDRYRGFTLFNCKKAGVWVLSRNGKFISRKMLSFKNSLNSLTNES